MNRHKRENHPRGAFDPLRHPQIEREGPEQHTDGAKAVEQIDQAKQQRDHAEGIQHTTPRREAHGKRDQKQTGVCGPAPIPGRLGERGQIQPARKIAIGVCRVACEQPLEFRAVKSPRVFVEEALRPVLLRHPQQSTPLSRLRCLHAEESIRPVHQHLLGATREEPVGDECPPARDKRPLTDEHMCGACAHQGAPGGLRI